MRYFLLFLTLLACSCSVYKSKDIQKTTVLEATQSWNGDKLPDYPAASPKVTVLKYIIPPKTRMQTHLHPVINAAYLLRGTLLVKSETDSIVVKQGESIVELVNKYHYGENIGKTPVEIIVFYVGDGHSPLTIVKQ